MSETALTIVVGIALAAVAVIICGLVLFVRHERRIEKEERMRQERLSGALLDERLPDLPPRMPKLASGWPKPTSEWPSKPSTHPPVRRKP